MAQRVVASGRNMFGRKAVDEFRATDRIGAITAPKSTSIRALVEQGQLAAGLFDERHPVELSAPASPRGRPGTFRSLKTIDPLHPDAGTDSLKRDRNFGMTSDVKVDDRPNLTRSDQFRSHESHPRCRQASHRASGSKVGLTRAGRALE
jgi:hypothetical protein